MIDIKKLNRMVDSPWTNRGHNQNKNASMTDHMFFGLELWVVYILNDLFRSIDIDHKTKIYLFYGHETWSTPKFKGNFILKTPMMVYS